MTEEQILTEIFNNDPLQLLEDIVIKPLQHGEYVVTRGNIQLHHTDYLGVKSNTLSIDMGDYSETISHFDERGKSLFIALHNYKHGVWKMSRRRNTRISISKGMCGYYAVLLSDFEDMGWETDIIQSGIGRYSEIEGAISEAKEWSDETKIPLEKGILSGEFKGI